MVAISTVSDQPLSGVSSHWPVALANYLPGVSRAVRLRAAIHRLGLTASCRVATLAHQSTDILLPTDKVFATRPGLA